MVAGAVTRQVGNLPADLTSFVGRRRELAEIRRLLAASRLVTLTGVGGVGKTRLALRAAAEQRRAFDSVWLVDLSTVTDPALVAETVASTMGVRDESAAGPVDALEQVLSTQRTLLVLDNCEHLRDACAVLADRLLRAAPELRVLATSRQSLGITGEHQMKISPLPVPEPGRPLTRRSLELYDGISLLTERAAAVLPGFTVTEDNHAAVAELCRQLDGIPLAIELAAVRLRALSVNALVERLRDRYRLLTGGSSTAVPRQQTLHALVDWSFQLLPGAEQTLWTRLSIFPSHFDLDAVEAVCTGGGIERDDVLDLLDALLDKSLLLREEHAGAVRYRMLDTLREFCRKRLGEPAERRSLQRRHRDHYLLLVGQAAAEWFGPDQFSWSRRLNLEQANLRAAMDFCLQEPCEAEAGLRMATLLTEPYWVTNAFYNEGRHWLDRMLAAATERTELRARALLSDAFMALTQGDAAAGLPLLDEGRALAEELGDSEILAHASLIAGLAAHYRGDYPSCAELLNLALVEQEAAGHKSGILMSLTTLAATLGQLGDRERATELFERSIELTSSHGERVGRAWALTIFAIYLWQCGDDERATALAREGLALGRDFGDRLNAATNLQTLAWLLTGKGRDADAARLLGAVEELGRTMGLTPTRVKRFAEFHENCLSTLRSRMGDKALGLELRRGRRMTPDEAIEEALGDRAEGGRPRQDETVVEAEPTPPGRPATTVSAAEPSPLTRREREIAELIAQGRSNKEIASALVISQRTVEGHVEHILDKLGFASRAQIAAWMAAREAGGRS
ncbi:ATP-binding protein [Microbispora siamensis]|uniref:LuxR family transcriptional regulator n=1 Tax=Microbispora siamensis TaxID=564413 RepID=A0ABQ4GP55_9ACTN|nr:LuxR C-terminal-related transcriptional regulator [Microbispora siamensis]GIH63214.1 LuxR family transcriptional regulator [Microbispora siamensis]